MDMAVEVVADSPTAGWLLNEPLPPRRSRAHALFELGASRVAATGRMHQRTCGAPSGPFRPRTSAQRQLQTDRSAQSYKLRHLLREIGDSSRVLGDGVHWQ